MIRVNASAPFLTRLRVLRRFRAAEDGSATVEVMLWFPFFLVFFFTILEATHMFYATSQIRRIVQDASRQYVRGAFDNTSALENWLEATLEPYAPNAAARASVALDGRLTTRVVFPESDVDFTGLSAVIGGFDIEVDAVVQTEL